MSSNQWHKKESPMQGMTGLWGGSQGALQASSGGGANTGTVYGIELWGAGGGAGAGSYNGNGGAGGYSKFTIQLPAGTYYATAGKKGMHGANGGYNQRGAGGQGLRNVGQDQGGGAGGFSGIWPNNSYTGNPIAMVGGGGGSDWVDQGGNGGGVHVNGGTGFDQMSGNNEYKPECRPIGATLTAGGFYSHTEGQPTCLGEAGVQLRGGDATCNDTWAGGGGGGGYWGGGAGTGNVGNGGTPGSGGSGYLDSTSNGGSWLVTVLRNTTAAQRAQSYTPGNGTYYQQDSNGAAMTSYGGGGDQNQDGQDGRVRVWNSTFTSLLHDISGPATNSSFTVS